MSAPQIAWLLPSLLMLPAMGLLSRIRSASPVALEVRRKALHIAGGLFALTFPLLLADTWAVLTALGLMLVWMCLVRVVPQLNRTFGCVLHAAGRVSYGELFFAIAVAALLLLAGDNPVLYVAPLMIMTLADAAAAIVGRGWPVGPLHGMASGKTASGIAAFITVAFLVTATVLSSFTPLNPFAVLSLSLLTACVASLAEAVSTRGTDNLTVPAAAWMVLALTVGGI